MRSEFSPPYDYESFELLVGDGMQGSYSVTVVWSPAGDEPAVACFLDPDDVALQRFLLALQAKEMDREFLEETGHYFFEKLFTDKVEQLYRSSLAIVRDKGKKLRVRLRIEPPELAALPWEYLFDKEADRFLVLSNDTAIVRHIPMPVPIRALEVMPPLRVLAVFISPTNLAELDIAGERNNLKQALEGSEEPGRIQLKILEHGTLATIGEAIRDFRPHVFHFVGHGFFENEKAYLALEDEQGESNAVDERAFSNLFEGCQDTHLVVLNACETGMTSDVQPVAGMAPRLLQREIGAIVAMQTEIRDDAAVIFGRVFYQRLAAGSPVDVAIAEARRAISQTLGQENSEWGVPVLFMRAQHEHLSNVVKVQLPPRSMPVPNPADFVGREIELSHFTQQLAHNRIAIVSGMAGVGKTALAATLARRRAQEGQIFWHTFYADEGMDVIVRKLAGWLARHGQDDLWRMLNSSGQLQPTETYFDHLFQLLTGHDFLLCLDDLHYVDADPLLEQLVKRLLPAAGRGELSLIITTRHRPALYLKAVEFEPLAGLTLADSQRMLIERDISLSDEQATILHRTTGGNATLLNLAIDLLQRAANPAPLLESLGTVQDIQQYLLEEVDAGLNEIERAVMKAVAVLLGYPGSRDVIEEVLDSEQGLLRTLTELSRRHLLIVDDNAYHQHAIVQTFYHDASSRRARRTMHKRAGEYYEFDEVDLLKAARHYSRSRAHEHAVALVAANSALLINQGEARPLLNLLNDLATRPLADEQELQLLETRGVIEYLLGDLKEAVHTFGAAAAKASDALARARLGRKRGEVQARMGEYDAALATFEQGRQQIFDVTAASAEDAQIVVGVATVLLNLSRYEEAFAEAKRALDALDQQASPQIAADLHDIEGRVHYSQGEFSAALAQFQAAFDLRWGEQDRQPILRSYSNLANVYGEQGRYVESVKTNEDALEIAEKIGDLVAISTVSRNIAADYAEMGQYDQAIVFNIRALTLAERMGAKQSRTHAHYNLGEAYRNQGDFDQATQHLVCAIGLAEGLGDRHALIGARRELAEVYLQEGKTEQAHRECLQALEMEGQSNTHYWRPHILSTLGEIQRRQRQWPEARASFEQAVQLLQDSGTVVEQTILLLTWSRMETEGGDLTRANELFLEAGNFIDSAEANEWTDQITTRIKQLQSEIKLRRQDE